ncbi:MULTISPECIES: hypothetical protein [unclassified Paenibacillus]|uniref:hypothetical protein n=1 Tax=unclassified Paenibacillus TaxID=185978 RepID=UPI0030F68824
MIGMFEKEDTAMQSTAYKLTDGQRPHLTLITPQLRVNDFSAVQEPSGPASDAFPNRKRADFRRYADHPLKLRIRSAGRMAAAILAYHHAQHVGGDGRFLTGAEKQRLERMADYILAEDHALGLTILRDPYDKPRDEDVIIPPGEGALAFMEERGISIYCLADAEALADGVRIKVCRTCEYPFEDRSPARNKRDCGDSCRTFAKKLSARRGRYGSEDLIGERSRMRLPYPFYNPQEMYEIENRSERAYGGYEKISGIAAAKERKESHGKKNTVQLVDKKGTEDNGYLDGRYGWQSDRNSWKGKTSPIWWGPVVSYNLRDRELTESFVDCESSYTVHISA